MAATLSFGLHVGVNFTCVRDRQSNHSHVKTRHTKSLIGDRADESIDNRANGSTYQTTYYDSTQRQIAENVRNADGR